MPKRTLAVTSVLTIVIAVILVHKAVAARQHELSTSVDMLVDGHVRLSVLNTSGSPITAIAAIGTRTVLEKPITVRSVRFFDSVVNPFGPKEIVPGKTYSFMFFGPNPPPDKLRREVQLEAAIFADGSTWGEPEWVTTLLLRRSSAYQYNTKVLKTIEQASSAGISHEELAQELGRLQKDDFATAKTTVEKQMIEVAYEEALLLLQDTARADGNDVPLQETITHARSRLLFRINRLEASKPNLKN